MLAAGLGLRLWVLASPLGGLDSDEAVTALIAEDMLDGSFSAFYWDQDYGGTLDSIVTAPVLAVFGSSTVAVKLVMVCFHAAACLLLWRLGRRLFGPRVGAVAGTLAWVLSPAVVWFSTKSRGFYGSSLVLAVAVALLVVRLGDRSPPRRGPWYGLDADGRDTVALGLLVGLAWWVSPIAFFVIGPALVVLAVSRRDLWRRLPLTVGSFLMGSVVWWAHNLRNGFPSLDQPGESTSTYVERLGGMVTRLLPTLLGLREPYSGSWVLGPVGVVATVVVLTAVVVVAWRARHRSWLLLAVVVGFPFVAAVPSATVYVDEPRYGYVVAPVLALVVAAAVGGSRVAIAVPAAVVIATVVGLVSLRDWAADHPGHWDLDPPALEPLQEHLAAEGVEAAYAEYWLAYRLAFEADLLVTPVYHVRNWALHAEVVATGTEVRLFYEGSAVLGEYTASLEAEGIDARRLAVGPYVVVTPG